MTAPAEVTEVVVRGAAWETPGRTSGMNTAMPMPATAANPQVTAAAHHSFAFFVAIPSSPHLSSPDGGS